MLLPFATKYMDVCFDAQLCVHWACDIPEPVQSKDEQEHKSETRAPLMAVLETLPSMPRPSYSRLLRARQQLGHFTD